MNLTYAGTHLSNGKPENGSACVTGFDQAGFVMGSSASLFNASEYIYQLCIVTDVVVDLANLGLREELNHWHVSE